MLAFHQCDASWCPWEFETDSKYQENVRLKAKNKDSNGFQFYKQKVKLKTASPLFERERKEKRFTRWSTYQRLWVCFFLYSIILSIIWHHQDLITETTSKSKLNTNKSIGMKSIYIMRRFINHWRLNHRETTAHLHCSHGMGNNLCVEDNPVSDIILWEVARIPVNERLSRAYDSRQTFSCIFFN